MKLSGLSKLANTVSHFLHRFHVTLFVLLAVTSLSVVALFLNQAVTQEASDTTTTPEPAFDKATMTRISNLHTSLQHDELVFPGGRINPFIK